MFKKYRKTLIITTLITLLPMLAGVILWNKLPEQFPIHFNTAGEVDGWSSKVFGVFGLPLILVAFQWLCSLGSLKMDPKAENLEGKVFSLVLWIIPVISVVMHAMVYMTALGAEVRVEMVMPLLVGFVLTIVGNYLPKCKQNYTIGIKVAWAYTSEENWAATHRFGGKVWVIGGVLMALSGFLPNGWAVTVMITVTLLATIIPIVYSWRFYKMEQAAGKDVKVSYSKIDKKITKWSAVFLAITTLFILAILFTGDLEFTLLENSFSIKADWYSDITIRYDVIEAIEYREQNVPGLRVGGFGSFRLLMGFFENEEFGTHTRYTYYDPESCIVLTVRGKAVVLSAKTEEETRRLYDSLLEKIN